MESESTHRSNDSDGGVRDTEAIQAVISKVKSQGLFDQFRKDCLADVDTKPAYQNLVQRVEMYVERFLRGQKWSSSVNKNQLRENLRRQLNNSGMMSNGVERIIDQVVNPKINLGIKPKIDEAVCDHLGIDLKARQEEQQRRKQEQQQLMLQQQQLQQQHLKTLINPNVKTDQTFPPAGMVEPTDVPWTQASTKFPAPVPGADSTVTRAPLAPPGMSNFPGVMQTPFSFMGGWPVGLPGMEGFNQTGIPPMIPGQPMIPPMFGSLVPPTGNGIGTFPISPASGGVNNSSSFNTPPPAQVTPVSTPVIPDLSKPPPGLPTTPMQNSVTIPVSSLSGGPPIDSNSLVRPLHGLVPPKTGVIVPPPPGSVPPPPGTVPVIRPSAPLASSRPNVPTTPTIPALISHTLAKASEDELTPEKIAVFKTAAAFITKTVNNAQGTPGADLATMFSPRVLAEAMMAESGVPLTKHEIRAAKRKERMKELDRLRAERDREEARDQEVNEDKEDPIPPKHNLMDVFQAAEDVSDDEEALDMLMDLEETEDKHKQGVVLSDDSDKEEPTPTNQPGKRYNFAWDVDINPGELSDVTISSIHTSDISSFEDDAISSDGDMEDEGKEDDKKGDEEKEQTVEVKEMGSSRVSDQAEINEQEEDMRDVMAKSEESLQAAELSNKEWQEAETVESSKEQESLFAADIVPLIPPVTTVNVKTKEKSGTLDTGKPRRLVALSYNYSDNEEEETREERKARIAREKEERYLKRQQRRADIEAKRKERDEERARLKEEKKRQKELQAKSQDDKDPSAADTGTEDNNATAPSLEEESPSKTTPRKRKNKAEMKEQLLQQKVMERKALRRQRTRNRRYASEEFTTIFSERKTLNQSYTTEPVVESEEIVTFDGALEVVEMTVDQECVVETIGEVVETVGTVEESNKEADAAAGEHPTELVLQCPSPYSDISDRSMSDKLEDEKSNSGMDKVSSDEELGDVEEKREDEKEMNKVDSERREESFEEQGGDQKLHDSPLRMTTRSHSSLSATESVGESTAVEDKIHTVSTLDSKSPTPAEGKSRQHYSTDELYKPRNCQRRVSSPLAGREPSSYRGTGGGCREQCESDVESQHSSTTKQSWQQAASVSSSTDLKITEQNELKSENVSEETEKVLSPKEPVDIMADLELEPVSPGDMSLDDFSPEEAEPETVTGNKEDRENDLKEPIKTEEPQEAKETEKIDSKKEEGVKEEESEPSDEGEIKSDSEEEKNTQEVVKERMVHRKPIELVDFGEAEKRVREGRYYTDVDRRNRTPNLPPIPYRGGYTASQWPQTSASVLGYSSSVSRYSGHEPGSPGRAKSPLSTTFDAESEASSHSRSSVRVRDDVPPPYPIEGVTQRHRSPGSEKGASSLYKPTFPPPSPVSSSSSSSSRNSRKTRSSRNSARRSKSRSSSSSSSSSSSRSSSSRSLRHKRKRPKQGKHGEKRKERAVATSPPKSHVPRTLGVEPRLMPPTVENLEGGDTSAQRERRFSSGHESISSDELPYFPDEEPSHVGTTKRRRSSGDSSSSGEVSSSPRRKRKRSADSPTKESISSSELIYSPTRKQSLSAGKNQALSQGGSSPGRSSISSGELPEDVGDTEIGPAAAYSPHWPSSPTHLPPMPTDMTGFQPPLPQELPPLPAEDQPPLPPSPPPPLPNDDGSSSFAEADSYQHTDFSCPIQTEPSRPPFSPVNVSENALSSYSDVTRHPDYSLSAEPPASPTAVNMEPAVNSPQGSDISDQPASPEMDVYTQGPPLLVIPLERRSSDASSPVHGTEEETPVPESHIAIHAPEPPTNDTAQTESNHAHASTAEKQSEDMLQTSIVNSHVGADTCQSVMSHQTAPVVEEEEEKSQEPCSLDRDNHALSNTIQEENPLVSGTSDEKKDLPLTGVNNSVEGRDNAGITLSEPAHCSSVSGENVESNEKTQDMGVLKLEDEKGSKILSAETGESLEPVEAVENENVQSSSEIQSVSDTEKSDTVIESSVNAASETSSVHVKPQSPDCYQGVDNAGVSTDSVHESRLSTFQASVPQAMCLIPSLLEDSPSAQDPPSLSQEAISPEKSSPYKKSPELSQKEECSASPQLEPSSDQLEGREVNSPSKSHIENQAAFNTSNPDLSEQSTGVGEVSSCGNVRGEEVSSSSEMTAGTSDDVGGVESLEKKTETVSHSDIASNSCAPTMDCERVSGHQTALCVSVLPESRLGKRGLDDSERNTSDVGDESVESRPKRRCIEKQEEDESVSTQSSGPNTDLQDSHEQESSETHRSDL